MIYHVIRNRPKMIIRHIAGGCSTRIVVGELDLRFYFWRQMRRLPYLAAFAVLALAARMGAIQGAGNSLNQRSSFPASGQIRILGSHPTVCAFLHVLNADLRGKLEELPAKMLQISNIVPPRIRLWTRAVRDWHHGEPELRILDKLCRQDHVAVDIGANYGVYSWYLTKYTRNVVAFEPQPQMANFLKAALGPLVQVEPVALSDCVGVAKMRIPLDRMMDGCATIEEENKLSKHRAQEISVPTRRLDGYNLGVIGFMKIDVEGHELKVLKGAEATLRRDRPNLLIEAEERHRPNAIASVIDYLIPLGYHGFCLKDGRLRSVENIEFGTESSAELYNFIFSASNDLSVLK
jgi:FkbM family methyltransferase